MSSSTANKKSARVTGSSRLRRDGGPQAAKAPPNKHRHLVEWCWMYIGYKSMMKVQCAEHGFWKLYSFESFEPCHLKATSMIVVVDSKHGSPSLPYLTCKVPGNLLGSHFPAQPKNTGGRCNCLPGETLASQVWALAPLPQMLWTWTLNHPSWGFMSFYVIFMCDHIIIVCLFCHSMLCNFIILWLHPVVHHYPKLQATALPVARSISNWQLDGHQKLFLWHHFTYSKFIKIVQTETAKWHL